MRNRATPVKTAPGPPTQMPRVLLLKRVRMTPRTMRTKPRRRKPETGNRHGEKVLEIFSFDQDDLLTLRVAVTGHGQPLVKNKKKKGEKRQKVVERGLAQPLKQVAVFGQVVDQIEGAEHSGQEDDQESHRQVERHEQRFEAVGRMTPADQIIFADNEVSAL